MTLPGENTLTLSNAALMRIVQERLNTDLRTGGPIIRVTAVKYAAYGYDVEFKLTSEPLPASDSITTTTKD